MREGVTGKHRLSYKSSWLAATRGFLPRAILPVIAARFHRSFDYRANSSIVRFLVTLARLVSLGVDNFSVDGSSSGERNRVNSCEGTLSARKNGFRAGRVSIGAVRNDFIGLRAVAVRVHRLTATREIAFVRTSSPRLGVLPRECYCVSVCVSIHRDTLYASSRTFGRFSTSTRASTCSSARALIFLCTSSRIFLYEFETLRDVPSNSHIPLYEFSYTESSLSYTVTFLFSYIERIQRREKMTPKNPTDRNTSSPSVPRA